MFDHGFLETVYCWKCFPKVVLENLNQNQKREFDFRLHRHRTLLHRHRTGWTTTSPTSRIPRVFFRWESACIRRPGTMRTRRWRSGPSRRVKKSIRSCSESSGALDRQVFELGHAPNNLQSGIPKPKPTINLNIRKILNFKIIETCNYQIPKIWNSKLNHACGWGACGWGDAMICCMPRVVVTLCMGADDNKKIICI